MINKTFNIDTGAVFGGKLTALKYPELQIVDVTSTMPKVPEKFRDFDLTDFQKNSPSSIECRAKPSDREGMNFGQERA